MGGREGASEIEFENINGKLHTLEIEAHADYILSPQGGTDMEDNKRTIEGGLTYVSMPSVWSQLWAVETEGSLN